jgi:hypothetical protein
LLISGSASRMPRLFFRRFWLGLSAVMSVSCGTPAVFDASGPGPFAGLPAGEGRNILINECLNCHELDALELFRDFYDQQRWRSLVETMRDNGAQVDDREADILAGYLAVNFGTGIE